MLILSALIGGLSAVMGYFFATWLNVSISGAMAAMTGVCYASAFLFSPANGVMTKKLRTLNMQKKELADAALSFNYKSCGLNVLQSVSRLFSAVSPVWLTT